MTDKQAVGVFTAIVLLAVALLLTARNQQMQGHIPPYKDGDSTFTIDIKE